MQCPCCLRGNLKFVRYGRLEFDTDPVGQPVGEAVLSVADGRASLECPCCGRGFLVRGWDARGRAVLEEETLVRKERVVLERSGNSSAEPA